MTYPTNVVCANCATAHTVGFDGMDWATASGIQYGMRLTGKLHIVAPVGWQATQCMCCLTSMSGPRWAAEVIRCAVIQPGC